MFKRLFNKEEKATKVWWDLWLGWCSTSGSVVKNPPASIEDLRDVRSIPGSGRCPGRGHGKPFQYSCLENPLDRGAKLAKSWTRLTDSTRTHTCVRAHIHTHTHTHTHGWDKEVRIRHEKTCAIYYMSWSFPSLENFFPNFKILLFFLICACVFVNVHVCVSQEQYFMLCLI